MNLGDPELELVDPTPNVHLLFLHFDQVFFWRKLSSRAVVRWSKRMYSCAGICSYDRGGLCDIALSEPLLKLRPRKDLVETLLHEMIHAYLFVTCRDQDRDGHGPNFKKHMLRINKAAGLNITIYHDFHEEAELYRSHWWRCNGTCQSMKPHFGIVRRTVNRAPGPSDYWWKNHQMTCGGTFVKIKEPENFGKGKKKHDPPKPSGDITKYINTTNNNDKVTKPILKASNIMTVKSITKSNTNSTIVVTKTKNVVFNPQVANSPLIFSGKGQTIGGTSRKTSVDVAETVRNIWADKQLSPSLFNKNNMKTQVPRRNSIGTITASTRKQKVDDPHILSPPSKIKKIDDYFKSTATSLLKDLYGKDFEIRETNNKRLSVVPVNANLVECPVCNNKKSSEEINSHIDECLNKEIIETIRDTDNSEAVIDISSETNGNYIKTEIISELTDWNSNVYVKKEDKSSIPKIKTEPSTSRSSDIELTINDQKCPCCGVVFRKSINEHLDECLAFSDTNTATPIECASTSFAGETIVIDDDDNDLFDETLTLNATGTKFPCPCCLKMIEQDDMNNHLDLCLS